LSRQQMRMEVLALGLRTADGIEPEAYRDRYGCDLLAARGDVIDRLLAEGYLRMRGTSLAPTRKGLACADALARLLS
jgi:coproporphyrinogen III oxidase-like Fe-S oxidoreductase